MADYRIYKLPDEPITVYVSSENPLDDIVVGNGNASLKALLDQQAEPVYHIADLELMSTVSFDQIVQMAYQVGVGQDAAFHHPALQEVLIVTTNQAVATAGKGLSSSIYGNIPSHVFDSMDNALAYAREQIAKSK